MFSEPSQCLTESVLSAEKFAPLHGYSYTFLKQLADYTLPMDRDKRFMKAPGGSLNKAFCLAVHCVSKFIMGKIERHRKQPEKKYGWPILAYGRSGRKLLQIYLIRVVYQCRYVVYGLWLGLWAGFIDGVMQDGTRCRIWGYFQFALAGGRLGAAYTKTYFRCSMFLIVCICKKQIGHD